MNENKDNNLLNFASNKYSQNGEDGIIEEIIKRLKLDKSQENWCVEFGAWDGINLSNSFNLVTKGWNAIYIEGDVKKFKTLLKTSNKFSNIFPINKYVSKDKSSKYSLDNILLKTHIPKSFDLLSIDIDSFDLEVWESLNLYNPKIVIIEINSSYLPGILKWHSNKFRNSGGNSFSATLNVAKDKGYVLVCHCGNMIFIKKELKDLINIKEIYFLYPELLYNYKWYSIEQENFIFKYMRRIKAFFDEKIKKRSKKLIKKILF